MSRVSSAAGRAVAAFAAGEPGLRRAEDTLEVEDRAAAGYAPATMTPAQLIAFLNALTLGDRDALLLKLEQAQRACLELEQPDLAQSLGDAHDALRRGDVRLYRKRVHTVVARLGHLRKRLERGAPRS